MNTISVGQLLNLHAENRDLAIAELSPVARQKLAHLASLGAQTKLREATDYTTLIDQLTTDAPAFQWTDKNRRE